MCLMRKQVTPTILQLVCYCNAIGFKNAISKKKLVDSFVQKLTFPVATDQNSCTWLWITCASKLNNNENNSVTS